MDIAFAAQGAGDNRDQRCTGRKVERQVEAVRERLLDQAREERPPCDVGGLTGAEVAKGPVGPRSSFTGLKPRNAENRLPIGGWSATSLAGPGATPAAVRPWYRCVGRSAASPRVTIVKNRPIDSTVAEFWKVFIMPAPAPRSSGGKLFMTDAWFGEKKRPMPTAKRKISSANHR